MKKEHWVKKLKKRLEELEGERDKYKDLYLRTLADFENYKKITKEEWQKAIDFANERLLKEFLTVFDHFRLALESNADPESFRKGVEMIFNEFKNIFKKEGLEEIEVSGKKFDPRLHEVIEVIESNELPPGMVVKEHQKGFLYKGKLLRPARVSVSKKPENDKGG